MDTSVELQEPPIFVAYNNRNASPLDLLRFQETYGTTKNVINSFTQTSKPLPQPYSISANYCKCFKKEIANVFIIVMLVLSLISIGLSIGLEYQNETRLKTCYVEGLSMFIAVFIILIASSLVEYNVQRIAIKSKISEENIRRVNAISNNSVYDIPRADINIGTVMSIERGTVCPVNGILIEGIVLAREQHQSGTKFNRKEIFEHCAKEKDKYNPEDPYSTPSPVVLANSRIEEGEGKLLAMELPPKLHSNTTAPENAAMKSFFNKISMIGLFFAISTLIALLIRFFVSRSLSSSWSYEDYRIIFQYFLVTSAIFIVAIPEGLKIAIPLSTLTALSSMAKNGIIVKKASLVQTMSNITCICVDKTGTLTSNSPLPISLLSNNTLLDFSKIQICGISSIVAEAILINTLKKSPESIDYALIEYGKKHGLITNEELEVNKLTEYRRISFNSNRKIMSTLCTTRNGTHRLHMKGNINNVLKKCNKQIDDKGVQVALTEAHKSQILSTVDGNILLRYMLRLA